MLTRIEIVAKGILTRERYPSTLPNSDDGWKNLFRSVCNDKGMPLVDAAARLDHIRQHLNGNEGLFDDQVLTAVIAAGSIVNELDRRST